MADKALYELTQALQVALNDLIYLEAVDAHVSEGYTTKNVQASTLALAILNEFEFTQELTTQDKTVLGAINEIAAGGGGGGGGSSVIVGTTDPTSAQGSNNDLYVKYSVSGQTYTVLAMFVKISGGWVNIPFGSGGSTVTITPTLATGTKIADYELDGVSGALYAPTGGGGSSDVFLLHYDDSQQTFDKTGTEIRTAVSSGLPIFLYANNGWYQLVYINETTSLMLTFAQPNMGASGAEDLSMWIANVEVDSNNDVTATFNEDSLYLSVYQMTGTLTAGSTSITLTIPQARELSWANSTIDVYTSVFGVNPTAMSVSGRNLTLTFEAQQTDIVVKARRTT